MILEFEPPDGPVSEAEMDEAWDARHIDCIVCDDPICMCPLACCETAIEVEEDVYIHARCAPTYRAELAAGEALGRALLTGGSR